MALVTSQAAQHTPPTVTPGWAPGVTRAALAASAALSLQEPSAAAPPIHQSAFISPMTSLAAAQAPVECGSCGAREE